jgi:hypothetical protein
VNHVSTAGSRFWRAAFRFQYRILALIDPLVRNVWRRSGIGNVVELEVARRNGVGSRIRLVGVLHANRESYIGHPNGDVGWTRDLEAAGSGIIRYHNGTTWRFTARRVPPGDERESVVRSTGQHPFPGNLVYLLGRRQVRAVGVYFRLTDTDRASRAPKIAP